ncbi:putative glycosyltransferase AGO61 [Spatholobus suberectus]|nr:putative glycosyltransferase AGO61 [Spatholobus suberectus]
MSWSLKLYARRDDVNAMIHVRERSLKAVNVSQKVPRCTQNHSIPTVLFSTRAYIEHRPLLKKLSNYEIMDIDRDDEVRCFQRVNVGLKQHYDELSIEES